MVYSAKMFLKNVQATLLLVSALAEVLKKKGES